MKTYKKILVAVDLEGGSETVMARASELTAEYTDHIATEHHTTETKVIILNVGHYPMPTYAGVYGEGLYSAQELSVDFSAIRARLIPQIEQLVEKSELVGAECVVEFGRPADLILELAEREGVDLIILGSHGKHGIRLLLGSTANSVLHHADCDVLAVRIEKKA